MLAFSLKAGALLLLIGCDVAPRGTEAQVISEVFGDTENFAMMKSAKKVTACRLELKKDAEGEKMYEGSENLDNYDEGPDVVVSSAQVTHLRKIFASPGTYGFEIAKPCIPVSGVRIRFVAADSVVDINLCFDCNILEVRRDGKGVGGEDFDSAEKELIALTQQLFPDDPEIQALKPH